MLLQIWTTYKWVHITSVKLRSLWSAKSKGSSICSSCVLIVFLITFALGAQLLICRAVICRHLWEASQEALFGQLKYWPFRWNCWRYPCLGIQTFRLACIEQINKLIKHNQVRFKVQQTYSSEIWFSRPSLILSRSELLLSIDELLIALLLLAATTIYFMQSII